MLFVDESAIAILSRESGFAGGLARGPSIPAALAAQMILTKR